MHLKTITLAQKLKWRTEETTRNAAKGHKDRRRSSTLQPLDSQRRGRVIHSCCELRIRGHSLLLSHRADIRVFSNRACMVVIAQWWLVSVDAREAERARGTPRASPIVGSFGELSVATTGPLQALDRPPARLGARDL